MNGILLRRFSRFMVSGGVVIIAYYAPYYILTEFCGVWYLVSSVVGSIISSVVNFLLQKFWTFENKSTDKVHMQALGFLLMSIGFTVSNGGMLYLLVGKFHMHYLLAQIIVSSILGIAGYFIAEWIFREHQP